MTWMAVTYNAMSKFNPIIRVLYTQLRKINEADT